ncbi:MAG: ribose-phosphate diphosphokinase [Casimicrobiaceae bacterium]
MNRGEPLLFALAGSRTYGSALAQAMAAPLAALEERTFEDGEHKTRPLAEVSGRDVYVVHSLHGDAHESVNDKLVRLLFVLAAVKDGGAARVVAVCPYLAYARKDRRTRPLDPVTVRYVAALFEASGVDCVVTMDAHNQAAFENAFRCRTIHLEAAPLFVDHFRAMLRSGPVTVVSPDAGGMKRSEAFRVELQRALGREVGAAFAEKYRNDDVVSGEALVGQVRGATAIIVDDLINAGTTLARATAACRQAGADRVFAAATHGVLVPESDAVLAASGIDAMAISDTIPIWRAIDPRLVASLAVVSTVRFMAEALTCLNEDRPMPSDVVST